MVSAHDVAAYILSKCSPMSTMKLQKLVYYAQVWHLVWVDEPLFADRIEAWANGPVVPVLFRTHRGSFTVREWPRGNAGNLSKVHTGTIDAVLKTYGGLDGRQLSYLTHSEDPWRNARGDLGPTEVSDAEITVEAMQGYYLAVDADVRATPVDEFDWGIWGADPAPGNG